MAHISAQHLGQLDGGEPAHAQLPLVGQEALVPVPQQVTDRIRLFQQLGQLHRAASFSLSHKGLAVCKSCAPSSLTECKAFQPCRRVLQCEVQTHC